MDLREYLSSPGALSASELASAIGLTGPAGNQQVWQWGRGYRTPAPESCVAIERATGEKVRRWDLRPDDWDRIWPELIGTKGAPRVKKAA